MFASFIFLSSSLIQVKESGFKEGEATTDGAL